MSNKEKTELANFLMHVLAQAAVQEIDCCFDLDDPSGCCTMDVVPCCRTCSKPVLEAWNADEPAAEYFCSGCHRLVAVSKALHCWICGVCIFPDDMREQIRRLSKQRYCETMSE